MIGIYKEKINFVVRQKDRGSFIFDDKKLLYFRIDWTQKLEYFPKEVPDSVADITFQMGYGLYGVRDSKGKFDEERYKKVMSFCLYTATSSLCFCLSLVPVFWSFLLCFYTVSPEV